MKIPLQLKSKIFSCDHCQVNLIHQQCHSTNDIEFIDLCRMQFIGVDRKQQQAHLASTILFSCKLNNQLFF